MLVQKLTLSVTQLNRQIRILLEQDIGEVYVEGEISNLSKPSSGHFYFTLKDSGAQVRCVYFKSRHAHNKILPSDGQQVVLCGTLSLYEARGDYQLIVNTINEAGQGLLYQQFEKLKNKLAAEGLFDNQRKKKLPPFPQTIGIITSSKGAALRDILTTISRRYPIARVMLFPSDVQGSKAPLQLIKALSAAIHDQRSEVLILARGGGCLEDLCGFNDEQLARAIAASPIPIVTGIGHETDFTIADFVADLRAATPTAAAAAVTPNALELIKVFTKFDRSFFTLMSHRISHLRVKFEHQLEKMISPGKIIRNYWQTLDYLERRLIYISTGLVDNRYQKFCLLLSRLQANNPETLLQYNKAHYARLHVRLQQVMQNKLTGLNHLLTSQCSTLHAISPLATLDRGYAIATIKNKILFSSQQVTRGDKISVQLSKGKLHCTVLQTGD